MKRVLFVNISLVNGGAEKSLVNLLNEIPKDKYEIDLLLFRKEGMFLSQIPEYVNIIETPRALANLYQPILKVNSNTLTKIIGTAISKILTNNVYAMREYRWRLFYRKSIKPLKKHYDVAIAYVVGECTYLVNDLIDADKKICWVHTDYINAKCDKHADDKYYKNMSSIVTISDKCANILKSVFPQYEDKIISVPNITSSDVLKKRSAEPIAEIVECNKKLIISVGRLIHLKGFDLAIEAAEILKKKGYEFKWFIIGNGELYNELNMEISRRNLTEFVYLLGSKENPYAYMSKSYTVVQTSRYEGKSVVLDEAKILGIPIVSTNYDTIVDQIIPGKEGLVVEMTPDAIAEGIEQMFGNQLLYNSIKKYLSTHEYGNQEDVTDYYKLID